MQQERRKRKFEGYYGCLISARDEFCAACVTQATGEQVPEERRKTPSEPEMYFCGGVGIEATFRFPNKETREQFEKDYAEFYAKYAQFDEI